MMKRLLSNVIVVAGVVAMMSSLALAQPEGGRRGGPGGFGGGGLGGLMAMKEVQKELKLTDEEVAKITKKLEELRPPRGEGGGFQGFRDLSPEEREKRMTEMRTRMEEAGKKIDEALKTNLKPEQYQRISELRLQREGLGSLDRAEIAEKLKLTTDQKEKIKTLVADMRPQFGRRGGGDGERPSREEMQKRREKAQADLMAVLTQEQKDTWKTLLGTEFKFPEGGPGSGRRNRPAAE